MFGLLNLDKPAGLTSRDVVNRVQRLMRPVRVGHAGTLDPIATGVLIVCLGPATRLVPYLHRFSKTYIAQFLLGVTSETDDVEAELQPLPNPRSVSAEDVAAALPQFRGRLLQTPPAHSAVKVQGRPAYKRARRGESLELPPREVVIHRLELREFTEQRMTLEVECSSGTYIRALGRDLGQMLGCGAVMSELRRTAIGPFCVDQSLKVPHLSRDQIVAGLQPARLAVDDLPSHTATEAEITTLRFGRRIPARQTRPAGAEVIILDEQGRLIAIAEAMQEGTLAPRQVFPVDESPQPVPQHS